MPKRLFLFLSFVQRLIPYAEKNSSPSEQFFSSKSQFVNVTLTHPAPAKPPNLPLA